MRENQKRGKPIWLDLNSFEAVSFLKSTLMQLKQRQDHEVLCKPGQCFILGIEFKSW